MALSISIQFAFINVFVGAFSGLIKVNEAAIFPLKFLDIAIMRPAIGFFLLDIAVLVYISIASDLKSVSFFHFLAPALGSGN